MNTKLVNKEIVNILANYLYNRPFRTVSDPHSPPQPTETPYRSINRPLDLYLRTYFTQRKYLGGSERSAISDKVYNLVRY